jgi:phosphate transport system permease protein
MAAASRRILRLKRIDRAAVVAITLGGISVVVCVFGILVFIAAEAVPLFRPATLELVGSAKLAAGSTPAVSATLRTPGSDEYKHYLYGIDSSARVVFYDTATGVMAHTISVPGLQGATVTATSRSVLGGFIAAGSSDGRVAMMQVRFTPQYQDQAMADLVPDVRDRGMVVIDSAGRVIRQLSYVDQEGRKLVGALVEDEGVLFWWTDEEGVEHRASVSTRPGDRITEIRAGRGGTFIAGTAGGLVYHWIVKEQPELTDVSPVGSGAVTALEWLIGGTSFVAGTEGGEVTSWFRAAGGPGGAEAMLRAHAFEPQGTPVVAIVPSPRDRGFVTVGADGSLMLRYQTSERTLLRLAGAAGVPSVVITPKADGLLLVRGNTLDRYVLRNAYPEASWKSLFGKTWYEGYPQPAYVWQSTGATDDFEPKMSLVPLIFGTIKGTFYAMLFAVPLAVLGALYTSQFVHPSLRAKIKPTVEIMAALPSVVIGFLAGLYLASMVEKNLVAVFVMIPLMPIAGTSGVLLWRMLPRRLASRLKPGTELALILPLLVLAGALALRIGPMVEGWLFAGDARFWLRQALGLTYDQRNCLVVGLAMGFAVVPIIFTISEDAFSSVPASLTAASLALGASRWQTAVRVVLPTARPGVFSATMVGFGRAVGETMIVLMATGNTPLMEWSIFNGIRTLSANIAVEIAEAPYGGTLYRTLFLSAALLFMMTFTVNTLAEVIRQRLRERYKAA